VYKRIIKVSLKGLGIGILYYMIFYVLILGSLIYLVIPYFLSSIGQQYGLSSNDIRDLIVSNMGYKFIDYGILSFFIIIYTIACLLREFVPYGSAIEGLLGIILLYYIMSVVGFGAFNAEIPDSNVLLEVDFSPLMYRVFYALIIATVASILLRVRSEYKKRGSER